MMRGRWKNRKIIVVLGSLWILGFAAWAFLLWDLLATSVNEGVLEGPREGVFWTASQYRNVYTRFDRQLILYATHVDGDFNHVQMQLDSLSVSFGFLQRPSEVSEYWLRIPRARAEIAALGEFMTRLKHEVPLLRNAPDGAQRVIDEVNAYWPKVNGLANYFRAIEMAQRDFTFHQLKERQRAIVVLGIILGVILCALFLLLFYTMRTRDDLLERQNAALDAERKASDRAFEMIEAKNAFLGMVSHELRTPLQAICGSIEILLARPQSDANLKTIRRLQNSASSLEALVKDLTDYIKLRSTKRLAVAETVGMASLLAEVLDPLRDRIAAKRIDVAQRIEPHDLAIRSDRKLLRQVLSNLIENSVKYTVDGSIDVSIALVDAPAGRQLKLVVRDTGTGIGKQHLTKIFEPFYRANDAVGLHVDGIGMGLAVVREIVTTLRGHVDVRSTVGEGSEFVVTLPAEAPDAGAPAADAPAWPASAVHHNRRALVVDDNDNARETLGAMLSALGLDTDLCSTGHDGVTRFNDAHYDLVVLDLELPDLSGFEVARRIRAVAQPNGDGKFPSILGVSAYESAALRENPRVFDEFLPKPVHLRELGALVEKLLA
ncbi:hybrid sensor histidine kinase/response regulator AtsR [Burkholderia sp. AU19243]|uniref:hybrid sensor histidine kinase/response regulator AtsR n=1 Tax=Burkholderia TaxID=32008 RepID=UPI000589D936|nr:hybrid sensor histidine kinase/response regulator AtsR [Burkholderia latens]MBR7959649.1 hybrid sensor histidine kinase/response regulator AtsR [Burkholderia vietnamiensis]MBR8366138.1 hybrid sensor histidine kinase/response regulator AtsR [Burkholderia sp. AU19243]MBR8144270.1 hybrid sensor histidine kinase/response regulator AtsR [Burkholderia vietnamiensis]MBY4695129.1 hybrid sensor histidine kinase/response regulator AtsR [Burkholderia latens]QTO46902.1 hybrid sensor histidine kinase/re